MCSNGKNSEVSEADADVNDVGNENESDDGNWLGHAGGDPLLNDVVIRTLFGYVKPNDLKACRLVCQKWTALSPPLARSRSIYRALISRDNSKDNHGITDFVALFGSDNCPGIPFSEFKIGSFDLKLGAGRQFIQLCGEMAKKIDLSGTREVHSDLNVAELLRSTPNLKYFKMPRGLRGEVEPQSSASPSTTTKFFSGPRSPPSLKYLKTLDFGELRVEEYIKICPTFFEELLSAAENISTLFACDTFPAENVGLELLKTVEKFGRESKIEVLSLPQVNLEILNGIQRMFEKPDGLKLKHLKIKYGSVFPRYDLVTWVPLVELMKESLVSLYIDCNYCLPPQFPRMPNLKLLGVGNHPRYGLQVNFQDFKDNFPALQCLKLHRRYNHIFLDENFIGTECCPLMEALCLGKTIVNLRTFEQTLTLDILPNLKELELKITRDGEKILQKIFMEMSRLEKLNVYGRPPAANNIESLITGFSVEKIKEIGGKELIALKEMTMEVRRQTISEMIQEHRTLPSIGNMTNLRHLTLNLVAPRTGKHRPFLSDVAGYFGFYTLKSLRRFNIADCKFSKVCAQILVAEMELDAWKIQRPGKSHIIPPRWNSGNDGGDLNFSNSNFRNLI